jgi:hypothetical protein
MSTVTKEQVTEEAKKLGLTVTDAQVAAYVTIGALPKKEDTAPPAGGDDDDPNGSGDSAGVKERIKQLNDQKKAALAEKKRLEEELKAFKDKEAAAQTEKDKQAGNFEKLQKDALDAKVKAEATAAAAKEKYKSTAIKARLETELLKAGCPADRLAKAVKLFDISKIGFNWTNEDALEFDIEDFGAELEGFKKDNDFLFAANGEEQPPSGYQGRDFRPNNTGGKNKNEARIKEQFSSLR